MKNLLLAAVTLGLSSGAMAASQAPNLFTCKNSNVGIELSYAKSSFSGEPQMNLTEDGQDLLRDDENSTVVTLQNASTALGTLVSALVNRRAIADAPTPVYSVMIPDIFLGTENKAKFDTVLLMGYSGGFRAAPLAVQRIERTVRLKCEARFVMFAI